MLDMDEKLMNRSVNEGFSGRPSPLGKEERNVFARHRDLKEPGFGMRKRLITPIPNDRVPFDEGGLDVANFGMVEITSEDEACPIAVALQSGKSGGSRAAEPVPHIIRVFSAQPQHLDLIMLRVDVSEI